MSFNVLGSFVLTLPKTPPSLNEVGSPSASKGGLIKLLAAPFLAVCSPAVIALALPKRTVSGVPPPLISANLTPLKPGKANSSPGPSLSKSIPLLASSILLPAVSSITALLDWLCLTSIPCFFNSSTYLGITRLSITAFACSGK